MSWDFDYEETKSRRMDGKTKHPFAITCRKCGSNAVMVKAFDCCDVELKCKSCGNTLSCGSYHTDCYDYSNN